MREIKYIAWHKATKTMYQVADIEWTYRHEVSGVRCASVKDYFPEKELILLQYTGRKDSKGREIYEGNILRYTRFGWRCSGHPQDNTDLVTYYKVIWDEAECAFKVDNKNMTGSLCFDDSRAKKNEIELIGNIYENPELLKGD